MTFGTTRQISSDQEGLQSDKHEEQEGQPRIRREPPRPRSLPELNEGHGSTTGIMPILRDPDDESAVGDENLPEE